MSDYNIFDSNDSVLMDTLIKNHPLALVIFYTKEDLHSTFIPLHKKDNDLFGHVSKNNIPATHLQSGIKAKIVFKGPDGYISPNWYEKPHLNVPTWNYCSVSVKADVTRLEKNEDILKILHMQLKEYEKDSSSLGKMPTSMLNEMIEEIVGLKFKITEIEGKFKLSQNRSKEDIINVIDRVKLSEKDKMNLSDWMKRIL